MTLLKKHELPQFGKETGVFATSIEVKNNEQSVRAFMSYSMPFVMTARFVASVESVEAHSSRSYNKIVGR